MCWLGRRRAGVIVNNEHRNGMDDLIQSYAGRYYLNVRLVYIYIQLGRAGGAMVRSAGKWCQCQYSAML